ncbi:MAG: hypothetical protein M0Q51_06370 [Bacteroidales bacterium]|nr:hypothetical protein [Bacteroidales bacterium]
MELEYILTIIGGFLLYATGLVGVYVNIRIKLKELEVKLTNLKEDLSQHKLITGINVKNLEERNTLEHDSISLKMDNLLEKVTEIRVEQATVSASLSTSIKFKTKQS